MTLSENISLRNICSEKRLPYDINIYVSGFVGF